jgi:hypothetical protein
VASARGLAITADEEERLSGMLRSHSQMINVSVCVYVCLFEQSHSATVRLRTVRDCVIFAGDRRMRGSRWSPHSTQCERYGTRKCERRKREFRLVPGCRK